jgi:hypothetical protein
MAKLTLVCCAHTWAALRIWFCQAAVEPNLALNALKRLLVMVEPAAALSGVPSGTKLRVISSGCTQELPVTE